MRIIDLDGPDGNAFALLGIAKGWAEQLGLEYKPIQTEMMSGDYNNLCKTFQKYFGRIATLETTNDDLAMDLYNEKENV